MKSIFTKSKKKLIRRLRYLSARFLITNRNYWKNRDMSAIQGYWDTRDHPSNSFLRHIMAGLDFESVLEIGSNCGNRLWLLSRDHPDVNFIGIDLNQASIEFGREQLQNAEIKNIELHCVDVNNIKTALEYPVDVIFSWATLMYIDPEEIEHVMIEICSMATRAIVMIELHDGSLGAPQEVRGVFAPPRNWKRNYAKILERFGVLEDQIEVHDVPEDVWMPSGGHAKAIVVKFYH